MVACAWIGSLATAMDDFGASGPSTREKKPGHGKRGDTDPPLPTTGRDLPSAACRRFGASLGRPEGRLRAKESPCAGAHLLLVLVP